jgi:hypothetical protein
MAWLSAVNGIPDEPQKGERAMFSELVDRAAVEIGIAEHVSVKETAESIDPLVTVSYPPKAVQGRIPAHYFMEADLAQVKMILADFAGMAQR